jgi:uncharacterized LabA/DUF88 family protein
MRCRTCSKTWVSYEENETDVAIAANIVRDAARGSMDTAIVVSGDSDLLPALRAAKDMQPTMAVVAPFRRGGPVQSSSASLRPASRSAAPSCGTLSFPRLSRVRSARCNAPAHWR